jgi:peptidoglycan hydrolase-like protein with peptidoglycan-binding domain
MRPHYAWLLGALLCASALLNGHLRGVSTVHAAPAASPRQTARVPAADFIQSLQRELKRAGYDPGDPDGKMGPSTQRALQRFQEAHGLSPTGKPDIPTLTRLLGQSLRQ